jgi:hypothetical protein
MSEKIFKIPVTLDILYELLDKICLLKETYYTFDNNSFNKMMYLELYEPFMQSLKSYYFPSKYAYLEKEPSPLHLIVVIKQICKYHGLKVTSKFIQNNTIEQTMYNIEHR